MSRQRYSSDRFNRVDLSSALLACATLFSIMLEARVLEGNSILDGDGSISAAGSDASGSSEVLMLDLSPHGAPSELPALSAHTRSLRAISVLLLWLRVPRLFLLSTKHGPLVLMLCARHGIFQPAPFA